MRRYRDTTPRWITARFASKCSSSTCETSIRKGERIFYYPSAKRVYCASCSEDHAAEYESRRFDEMVADAGGSPW